jgi:hypothetical protein
LSPSRKDLVVLKYPPLFVSQTVQRYLTEFKVDNNVIEKVKHSLVGRPLCCRYFVEEYRNQKDASPLILLAEVEKKLKSHFHHHMRYESGDTTAWLDHIVMEGISRRKLLVDFMTNGEISCTAENQKDILDFVESVNMAFLPIYHYDYEKTFRYDSCDLIALRVLLEILNETATEGDLDEAFLKLNADQNFRPTS